MRVEFIESGKRIISTNRGVFKDNELIWYDNAYVLSLKFDEEKVEIEIKRILKLNGKWECIINCVSKSATD
jgi:hypothetical protein